MKVCRCGQEGVEQFGGRLSRHWFVQELLGVRFCVDPSGVSGWVQGHALTLFGIRAGSGLVTSVEPVDV